MKTANLFVAAILTFAPASYANEFHRLSPAANGSKGIEILASEADPADQISPGLYGSSHGYFGGMEVTAWADEYNVSTCASYGTYCFPTTFNLTRTSGNTFNGRGQINVRYDDVTCSYRVTVTVKAYSDRLFIRSNQPSHINDGIINNICPQLASTEFVHRDPYVIQNQ